MIAGADERDLLRPSSRFQGFGLTPLQEYANRTLQPRTGLAGWHARRQLGAGARQTAGTIQSVQRIFRDFRLDLGDFLDLVPQRFRIVAEERFPAAPTVLRFQHDDGLTFLGRYQRALVLWMSWLTALFFLALPAIGWVKILYKCLGFCNGSRS